jgi:hypothetical protein
MGIEYKYKYIYYMVLNEEWIATIRGGLEASPVGFSWELVCKVINQGLEESKDWTVNNLKVDYSQHCDDIKYWIRKQVRHKDHPVFVQFSDSQPIIKTGSGPLFVLYEPYDDDRDEEDVNYVDGPPDTPGLEALNGYGGRL